MPIVYIIVDDLGHEVGFEIAIPGAATSLPQRTMATSATRPARPRPRPPRRNGTATEAPRGGAILAALRQRILNWHYPPGHHLGEHALCAEFSASRIPIREALRALSEQGLVDKVPNQGCFVKQPDVDDINDLYEMRLALELHVGEALCHQPPATGWVSTQRSYWEPLLAVRADEPVDGDELVQADADFHFGLAQASGNRRIADTLREISERLRFVRLAVITTPHRVQETAGEHLAILDAIARQDLKAVHRALRQNINHARNKVELAIGRALMLAHSRK